jgi:hypothetical protein
MYHVRSLSRDWKAKKMRKKTQNTPMSEAEDESLRLLYWNARNEINVKFNSKYSTLNESQLH